MCNVQCAVMAAEFVSSICHTLTTAAPFHLLLSFALRSRLSVSTSTSEPGKGGLETTRSGDRSVDGISRDDQIQPPGPVAQDHDKDQVDPGPVHDIPHEFSETLGI